MTTPKYGQRAAYRSQSGCHSHQQRWEGAFYDGVLRIVRTEDGSA